MVEVLISSAILVVVLAAVTGLVFAARSSTKYTGQWSDRTQQVRVGLNQIAEDLSYGSWSGYNQNGQQPIFVVSGNQTLLPDQYMDQGWSDAGLSQYWEGWPGYFGAVRSAVVEYRFEEGTDSTALVRTVYDGLTYLSNLADPKKPNTSPAFAQQTLARDLNPYTGPAGTESYFDIDSPNQLVEVVLRTTRQEAGGNEVAEVSGQWWLPAAP